jgi:hypothetical protein
LAVLTWFALQLYQWRVGLLPVEPNKINYYADISLPLLGAFVFGFCLLAMVAAQDSNVVRGGNGGRLLALFLIFAVLEVTSIGVVTWRLVNPTPAVVVTRNEVYCPARSQWLRIQWVDVADISVTFGRYGKKYAQFDLGPKSPAPTHPTPFWTPQHVFKECRITGLNEDDRTVYQSMFAAWRKARGLSAD